MRESRIARVQVAAEEAAGEGRDPARGPGHPRVEQFRRPGALRRSRVPRPEQAHPCLAEEVVPGEDLVGSLPRHHDLVAVVPHQFREQEQRCGRRAQDRGLGVPDDLGEDRRDVGPAHHDVLVLGPEQRGHLLLVLPLVELAVGEAQRERAQGGVRIARDDGGRDGRVEAARKVRPDRDVAAQEPQAGRLDDPLPEGLGVLLDVLRGLAAPLGERDAPVGSLPEPARSRTA